VRPPAVPEQCVPWPLSSLQLQPLATVHVATDDTRPLSCACVGKMPVSMTKTCAGVPVAHGAQVYDESSIGEAARSSESRPQRPELLMARVQVSAPTLSAGGSGGGGGRGGGKGGEAARGGGGERLRSPGCATSMRCSGSTEPKTSLLPLSHARLACACEEGLVSSGNAFRPGAPCGRGAATASAPNSRRGCEAARAAELRKRAALRAALRREEQRCGAGEPQCGA
jgi:hypothetical protein